MIFKNLEFHSSSLECVIAMPFRVLEEPTDANM